MLRSIIKRLPRLRQCPPAAIALLACGLLVIGAGPAMATGALESFTLTPSAPQAGGHPDITADLTFSYENSRDSVQQVTITLAPGMIASIANVPATCSQQEIRTMTCPPGSQIGTGSATLAGGARAHPATLYLMPAPTPSDGAGLGAVVLDGTTPYIGLGSLDVVPGADGRPVGVVKVGVPVVGGLRVARLVATMSATTFDGKPFTRLPTSCAPASSSATAETAEGRTGSASDRFVPTDCAALGYAPALSAVEVTDRPGAGGADVVLAISQPNAATESAAKAVEVDLPPSVVPVAGPAGACLTGTPCTIGTATATSPLMPDSFLSGGTVTLGGSAVAPTVTVAFPEPVALSITGTVDVASGVVTFSNLPDLPLSTLRVAIGGTPGGKVLGTTCKPGDVVTRFTPWSGGVAVTSARPIDFRGCSTSNPPPTPPSPSPARPRVSIHGRRASVAGRDTSVTLACRGGAAGSTCRGKLSLTRRLRVVRRAHHRRTVTYRTIVLARTRYSVENGQTQPVALRLTDAGARLLARDDDGRLRVRATATLKSGPTAQRAIVVRRKPKS